MLRETLAKVRKAVGKDFPVWIKIDSQGFTKEDIAEGNAFVKIKPEDIPKNKPGLTVEDFIEMCKILDKDGNVDVIEVTGMLAIKKEKHHIYFADAAMRLSKAIKTPVILTGGVRTKEDIMKVYMNSNVNFFGMSRPFLKNPNYLEKLKN